MKRILFPLALCLALLGTARAAKPVVAVTIPPQAWLVRELAGEVVEPLVVVGAGQDPHTFEPSASQLAALSRAKLWLTIGLPFEGTVGDRLRAIAPSMRFVAIERGVVPAGKGRDPHIWLSPPLMAALATNACTALEAAWPDSRGLFRAGLARVTKRIGETDGRIRASLAGCGTRVFWVQHPSWGYFAAAYGLEQKSLERHGAEPTPRQLVRLADDAKREGVRVLFSDPRHDPRMMKALAAQIGAVVVPLDPLAEDWEANLLAVARRIAGAE